ncbi:MAG TPA: DMT family transporter [Glaciihabitans sp.]|jgi:drug/metabolite transporter (DMT)-like permease|nr:DMT family transporter [Glaciihabitans sp.]
MNDAPGTTERTLPAPGPTEVSGRLSIKVFIAISVTVLAWASAFVVIRGTAEHFTGGGLALARLLVGAILLGVVVLLGRTWVAPTRRQWFSLVVFGLAWFGAYNVALNIAEQTLDAGTTAMLINIGPILIALGAGLFLGEGVPKWLAIGAGVAFFGVILIGIATSGGTGFGDGSGVMWCLLAAVTYAVGVLVQKPLLRQLPAAQVTALGCAIGMVACLPFSGELVRDLQSAPGSAWLGAIYLGAVPTALAFSTWAYALTRVPAGQLSITTYVVPPIAVVLGLLAFGEVPAPLAIVGGAICLVGVALSRRKPRTGASA